MLTSSRYVIRRAVMLGAIPRHSKNIFPKYSKFFSSVPLIDTEDFKYEEETDDQEERKVFSTTDLFENVFATQNSNNLMQGREGAVYDVSEQDLAKYFPEGLAGEMDDENDLIEGASWMIRDSSKLLIRLLDEFVATKGEKLGALTIPKSIVSTVCIPTLTDRPEWEKSVISVKHFGKELTIPAETLSDNVTVAGEGSLVDNCINNLRQLTPDFPKNIMITGDRGTGKSASLNQMVLHARQTGWLVMFIPKGWDQVQRGDFLVPLEEGSSLLDNQQMSAEVLRGFWRAHHDKLQTLPIMNLKAFEKYASELALFDEEWDRVAALPNRERDTFIERRAILGQDHDEAQDELDKDVLRGFDFKAFQPKTLEDMIRFGVAFRQFAGRVFMDLLQEIRQVEAFPVLVAVDQYNAWETVSAFEYENTPVHSKDIVVPHMLNFITRSYHNGKPAKGGEVKPEAPFALKYGMCVAATSNRHPDIKKMTFYDSDKSLALNIKVPHYSQMEILSAVSKYAYRGVIDNQITLQEFLAFRTHVGSNPRHTRREAIPFFFPRAVKKDSVRLNEEHRVTSSSDPSEWRQQGDQQDMDYFDEDDDDEEDDEEAGGNSNN